MVQSKRLGKATSALLCLLLIPIHAEAQEAVGAAPDTIYKNAATAIFCSVLIPGGGHLYAGDTKTGGALLGVAALSVSLGFALVAEQEESYYQTEYGLRVYETDIDRTPIFIGCLVASIPWIIGILNSPGAVRKWNSEYHIRSTGIDSTKMPEWRKRPPPAQPRIATKFLFSPTRSKGIEVKLLIRFR